MNSNCNFNMINLYVAATAQITLIQYTVLHMQYNTALTNILSVIIQIKMLLYNSITYIMCNTQQCGSFLESYV